MSLKLVWNVHADAYADHNLEYVVVNVLACKVEVFPIGQVALLDAFRKAIVYNLIEHTSIVLEVDGKVHAFNEYGNFNPQSPFPIPDLHTKIVCSILQGQVDKKRAAKLAGSVD